MINLKRTCKGQWSIVTGQFIFLVLILIILILDTVTLNPKL